MKCYHSAQNFLSWELYDAAVALHARKAEAEAQLVAAVLADPARGVPVAVQSGVTPAAFDCEDLRLIYSACDVARDRPLLTVLRLVREVLRSDGFWKADGPVHRGACGHWNDESLAALAASVFHSPTAIRHHARQLLDARSRIRDAERLMGELRDVLLSGDAPAAAAVGRLAWVPPPARQPSEVTGAVVMPVRFHRHRAGKRGAA